MWVESEVGSGSAFSLELAAAAAVSDAYRVRRGAGLKTGGDKVTLRDS